MTILTGVVLTVALGAVAQRSDVFSGIPTMVAQEPRDDVVSLAPGEAALIDVVANDRGVKPEDGRRLLITREPTCGVAWRQNGMIAYSAGAACTGVQSLRYCVAQGDACREAELRLVLDPGLEAPRSASRTPVTRLADADVPISEGFAAFAGPTPPRQGGFKLEGPLVRPSRDPGPFAAIGLPIAQPAEAQPAETRPVEARPD